MAVSKGSISIHAQNIMPIIKRWLYSDKDIFIRELVSNGCDAIVKQKMVAPETEAEYRVLVTLDVPAGEIRFDDNGIGMTDEEIKKYINQVAFSGAEEFLKNYEGDSKGGIIGHFGLGFYSAFMVADKVTIDTLSDSEGAEPVRWISEDGMAFTMETGDRTERGTVITLHISEEESEFLEEYRLRAAALSMRTSSSSRSSPSVRKTCFSRSSSASVPRPRPRFSAPAITMPSLPQRSRQSTVNMSS